MTIASLSSGPPVCFRLFLCFLIQFFVLFLTKQILFDFDDGCFVFQRICVCPPIGGPRLNLFLGYSMGDTIFFR